MVAEVLNNFFSNVITNLNLPPYINALINTENVEDPVLEAKMKYINHPSIKNTVKPLYSGHHWDLKIVTVTKRCPLHRGFSKIGLFCFKNLL